MRVRRARATLILKVASRRQTRVVTGSWQRLRKLGRRSSPRKRPRHKQTGAMQKASQRRNLRSLKPKLNRRRTTRTMRWTSMRMTSQNLNLNPSLSPKLSKAMMMGQLKRSKRRRLNLSFMSVAMLPRLSHFFALTSAHCSLPYIISVRYSKHKHYPRLRQVASKRKGDPRCIRTSTTSWLYSFFSFSQEGARFKGCRCLAEGRWYTDERLRWTTGYRLFPSSGTYEGFSLGK